MPQTGVVTILGIDQRNGTGKTGKPYTLFKVKASDGNTYDTFEAPIAQAAGQSNGAPVILDFEARVNGQYTNYDLKGVTLAQNGVVAPAAVVAAPPVAVPATAGSPAPVEASTYAQDKDARITRLSAASTAFAFAAAAGIEPNEAIALAARIETFANVGRTTVPKYQAEVAEPVEPAQAGAAPLPWEA